MKPKLSPWHSADTKPVHVGVYQVKTKGFGNKINFSMWNGEDWSSGYNSQLIAEMVSGYTIFQNKQWRGIVK